MSGTNATDSELMLQFTQHTQQDAFAELVNRHSGTVFGVCSSVLRHTQDAEDAYQETFLTLARRANTVRQHASLAGWLYRVARRVSMRMAKQRKATEEDVSELLAASESPLEIVARREVTLMLLDEISKLPLKYRDVIVLCHLQGITRQAAADQLECTEDSVKARLVRAKRSLRIRLARRGISLAFAVGYLTHACQQSVRAELTDMVVNNSASPPPPIQGDSPILDGAIQMKTSFVASTIALAAMLLIAVWPVQSESSGPNENTLTIQSVLADGGPTTAALVTITGQQQVNVNDERRMTFEKQQQGTLPQYWKQVLGEGAWEATNEFWSSGVTSVKYSRPNTAPKGTSVLVLEPAHVHYGEVDVSVRVRLKDSLPGTGGGVIWRYQDPKNFYSATLDANGMVEVHRTQNGDAERLLAASSKVTADSAWPRLRVVHLGQEVSVFVDGGRVAALRESSQLRAGKVGVASSSNQLGIDDFQVKTPTTPNKTSQHRLSNK